MSEETDALEAERAMGIEPPRATLQSLRNMGSRVAPILKRDGRVSFRGMWGHVGVRERHAATSDVRGDIAGLGVTPTA
jgi:hypothetical protein